MTLSARQAAVQALTSEHRRALPAARDAQAFDLPKTFGVNVFSDAVQRQRLPKDVYRALRRTVERGEELDRSIADSVANAMKDWAAEHGATHYTHWFQPMTGLTAEKHDSFLSPTADGRALMEFSGKELIKGEPDASSFPSGGIRATFEARGYTAWDPTSPAFLRESDGGPTLTIPTAFCSWTGEALDKKTPLLRSIQALSLQAVRLLRLIGDEHVRKVFSTVGAEQEYFLVDRRLWALRPDLVSCGRTLFGARPAKGQELEDHYFGAITQRVLNYMMELELELWRHGIPIKTRHKEVAPHQFELAPVFEHVTVSTDHNMLCMELMKDLAERHGLACLLHEKPFAGVNGSGKHNNWSMADDQGNNLLEPGSTPHDNLKFMLFLTAVIRAVDLYQDLLRTTVASSGNDHRLGANEAPPAIISIYVGSELEDIVNALIEGRAPSTAPRGGELKLGVNTLPALPRDTSDRNRTSPFAFTGNKFEFRAVGASQSIAGPNTILNTIVAESLDYLASEIEARSGPGDRRDVIQALVRQTLTRHRRILFNGDNYTEEWMQEAERRGLSNFVDSPSAIAQFATERNVALLAKYGVLSEREAKARSNVKFQKYAHRLNVEALATREIAATRILPAALTFQERLARSISSVAAISPEADLGPQRQLLARVAGATSELARAIERLAKAQAEAEKGDHSAGQVAVRMRDQVKPAMVAVRAQADLLETLVDDDLWPLPKYGELLSLD
jgi:glutamine synthetase